MTSNDNLNTPDFWDTASGEPLTEYQLLQQWADLLDDGADVTICGRSYSPSLALSRVDPIAYRCDFLEWLDGMLVGGEISETDPDAGWSDVPVDSTYHPCCHAIGTHGQDCGNVGADQ